jgi:Icc-related predicted phosphoesterase
MMVRVAAVGDLHAGLDSVGRIAPGFRAIDEQADLLLLAGDLTKSGLIEEAEVLREELREVPIPVVAVLGNHDHHSDVPDAVAAVLARAGIVVLEASAVRLNIGGEIVGVVGAKGFGGGFLGVSATEFGEPEMKAFVRTTQRIAEEVEHVLATLRADHRILLLHYAPIPETLQGEPPAIYPFLGSFLFAEVADRWGVDVVIHGHAHRGVGWGLTPGGIPVRNVAQPVVGRAYALLEIGSDSGAEPRGERST